MRKANSSPQCDSAREFASQERYLHLQLHAHVQDLSFPAYCLLIRLLLSRSGYSTVRNVGHGATRKCTGEGGLDLLAFSHTDLSTTLCAVQVKQLRHAIPRRFVDELRGLSLRSGCCQGLIFATSNFSVPAKEAAGERGLCPVRLIDGTALTQMLFERRLGLRPLSPKASDGDSEVWVFDPLFFETLEARAKRTKAGQPKVGGAKPKSNLS